MHMIPRRLQVHGHITHQVPSRIMCEIPYHDFHPSSVVHVRFALISIMSCDHISDAHDSTMTSGSWPYNTSSSKSNHV